MIFYHKDPLQKELSALKAQAKTLGFVPTMGALHQGHLSLVAKAQSECDVVVVSIFVNPTQFDNASDLDHYPRTLESDVALLNTLSNQIRVFAPSAKEVYGTQVESKRYRFGSLENTMEGRFRKGHFDGVGTVLNLLFRAIMPHKAYFGEKDFQQLQVVRKLISIEKLPIEIVGCAIAREDNGLAMSSRNTRLSEVQRSEATLIFKTLKAIKQNFDQHSISELNAMAQTAFDNNKTLELEYFEIAPVDTLIPAKRKLKNRKYRAFVAAFCGPVRLIDNMALN